MTAPVALPYTRTEHRLSLKYKTSQKLTANDDLDYYINKAEIEALAEFVKFHPGLQRDVRDSDTTDANGILLMDQGFSGVERFEDSNKRKYELLSSVDDVWNKTGYFFVGFDQTNKKHKIQFVKDNAVLASTTVYWWNIKLAVMAADSGSESAIPYGYKQCIDYLAAKMYWEDQGSAPQDKQARYFAREYETIMAKARDQWTNASQDPEWVTSVDPDSGQFGGRLHHNVT